MMSSMIADISKVLFRDCDSIHNGAQFCESSFPQSETKVECRGKVEV